MYMSTDLRCSVNEFTSMYCHGQKVIHDYDAIVENHFTQIGINCYEIMYGYGTDLVAILTTVTLLAHCRHGYTLRLGTLLS